MPVFGRFELQAERRLLLRDGNPIAIGARAFDVLLSLAERRDRIVTKAELLDLAWPGLIVEENNLQVQISSLRKVLGSDCITTIPGRGYRFTAALDGAAPAATVSMVGPTANGPAGAIGKGAVADLASELAEWEEQVWMCDPRANGASPEELLSRVRRAVAWSLSPEGDLALGLDLLSRSQWLWESLNLAQEGATHLAAVERACQSSSDSFVQSRYWHARAFLGVGVGFHRELPVFAARAVAWARVSGDHRLIFQSLTTLAILCARSGDLFLGQAALAEALHAQARRFPARLRATQQFAAAEIHEAQGRLDLARRSQNERLSLLREAGASSTELHARAQMLAYETAEGHPEEAAAEASGLLDKPARDLPAFRGRRLRMVLADALLALGHGDDAHDALRAALPLLSGASAQWETLDLCARLWALRQHWPLAAQLQYASDECHSARGVARRPYAVRERQRLVDKCALLGRDEPVLAIPEALARALGPIEGRTSIE